MVGRESTQQEDYPHGKRGRMDGVGAPVSSVLQHEADLLDGKILVIVQGPFEYLLQVQSLLLEIQVFETEFLVA